MHLLLLQVIAMSFLLTLTALPPAAAAQTTADDGVDVALRSRSLSLGELVVVEMRFETAVSSVEVDVFGRTTPAYQTGPQRWEALVGIDLDQAPGDYVLTARTMDGTAVGEASLTVTPRKFPRRTLRVNPAFVNPPPALLKRIVAESRFVREVYDNSATTRLWSGPWQRPVPHRANSRFGSRSVFNGQPRSPHSGTDLLSPAGTPVRAPNAGRVVVAREMYFNGNIVIIDHGLGVFSQLAHLSRIDVEEGALVEAGQVVGLVGATGRVTGAHLHWGLRVRDARVDPLAVLELFADASQ